jgi:hypothetical protein
MGGFFNAEIFSGIAVLMSAYTLWNTSLRRAVLKLFVPPLTRYASPYTNSVFEVFEIPITLVNQGAQTGIIMSMDLEVTNIQRGTVKKFYSAGLGTWSLAKSKGEEAQPFSPLALTGKNSTAVTVLFYARTDSTVMQIVEGTGRYRFAITPVIAGRKAQKPMFFEMDLPYIDHRAFTTGSGTLALHHPDWKSSS